jgi:hypothetical protein
MAADGTKSIFTEPVLVMSQKVKDVEVVAEYTIRDRQGERIGSVRQVRQSILKKIYRLLVDWDEV